MRTREIEIEVYEPVKRPGIEHHHRTEDIARTNKYCGLLNRGSTCYLNSLIQSLFMTPEFRSNILKWKYDTQLHGKHEDCIPFQLQKLFARMQLKCRDTENTDDLTKSFQWDRHQLFVQQDIQELCRVLFDAVSQSMDKGECNFIEELYQGAFSSIVQCLECNFESEKKDKFLDLSLPVKKNTSLEMSLCDFLSKEKLENENQYFCSHCDKKVDAVKFIKLTHLPKILFLQLNRFEYDYMLQSKKKICDRLEFPLVLDMNIFLKDHDYIKENLTREMQVRSVDDKRENVYELFSVVVHSGSARGGHYYSYIKSFEDSNWYKFDDSAVSEEKVDILLTTFGEENSTNVIASTTGYILMYRLVSTLVLTQTPAQIPEELQSIIDQENILIRAEEEKQKEKLTTLQLNFIFNDKSFNLVEKKSTTVYDLKLKVMKEYDIFNSINHSNARICSVHNNTFKFLEAYTNEMNTLEDYKFVPTKTYSIEIKNDGDIFHQYNPDEIVFNILQWEDRFSTLEIDEKDFKFDKIIIDRTLPLRELKKIIYSKYNIENCGFIFIFKKVDFGSNHYQINELQMDNPMELDKEIHNHLITDGVKIFFEIKDWQGEATVHTSKFLKMFDAKYANVTIQFNIPLDRETVEKKSKKITIKSYQFDQIFEIKKSKTILHLKNKISQCLNIPSKEFIMKRNSHNGAEIKSLTDPIEKYTSTTMNIYIEYGTPQKENEIKIKLFKCDYDFSFFLVFPYRLVECGNILLDLTWTVAELKSHILKQQFMFMTNEGIFLIREYKNERPGKIYHDALLLKDLSLKEGGILIAQDYQGEIDMDFGLKDIQVSVREWDPGNWKVSSPKEVVFSKGTVMTDFISKLTMLFPDIPPTSITGFKIMNEVNLYMDELNKAKFINLHENGDCLVDNFPLFINTDGCMLIVKNNNKIPREPTQDEIRLYCKPTKVAKSSSKPSTSSKTASNKKTHHYSNLSKQSKEKALVIKVKNKQNETKSDEISQVETESIKDNSMHSKEIIPSSSQHISPGKIQIQIDIYTQTFEENKTTECNDVDYSEYEKIYTDL